LQPKFDQNEAHIQSSPTTEVIHEEVKMFSTIAERISEIENDPSPLKQLSTEEIHQWIKPFINKNLHFEFLVDEFWLWILQGYWLWPYD